MRRLSFLALALLTFALLGLAKEDLPEDERGLFQYAAARANRQQWPEAERVYLLCLERFPEGELREQVHYQLGQLHLYQSKRMDESRKWFERLCERFPKSELFWQARWMIGYSWAQQNRKPEALAEYRRILHDAPDAYHRTNAANQILNLQNKWFQPYVSQTFTEGQAPEIQFNVRNIDAARMRLYRLPCADVVERLEPGRNSLQDAVAAVPAERRELVKEWKEFFRQPESSWSNKQVELPVRERGLYELAATHDEITRTVVIVINRYGLVVKTASDRTLVFAQDRVSGAPVGGMRVRVYAGDDVREGVTGDGGLYEGEAVPGTAFVLGVKGDEYAFSSAWFSGFTGEESLFHFVTDRPIYRPAQTVRWKLSHRVKAGEQLHAKEGLKVRVYISDPRGNRVYEGDHALNAFGSCHGEITLGEEPELGVYQMQVQPLDPVAGMFRWWENRGQFRVDEYRKPEYEVKVTFDKERYIQGDTLVATIAADYYFGSPVPRAQVSYRILRNPHYVWWGPQPYWLGWYRSEREGWYHGGGEQVHQGAGFTDENGRLRVTFELPRWERDARYLLIADATDLSRRQVTGTGSTLATRAEFGVSISVDKYMYRPHETIGVRLAARTHDGKPVANRLLRLTASHRTWRDGEHHDERISTTEVRTDEKGDADVPLKVAKEGYMHLHVEAKDDRGNETDADRSVWVASSTWQGGYMNWQGVDVVADRDSYRAGDRATFLISSEVKDLHLLFTLEGDRIYHKEVVKLNGHTATVTVTMTEAMAPTSFASLASLHGNGFYTRQRAVVVDPSNRFLTVTVEPDREKYKPRDPATVKITTKDAQGNPVPAEVSLGIVDESIYALQKEYASDIRQAFVPQSWNRVQTTSSLQFWDAGRAEAKEELAADAGAGAPAPAAESRAREGLAGKKLAAGGEALVEPTVRTRFADTMYWNPEVVTGEDGTAVVRLDEISDNLTTWRVTARAMGLEGLVGQESATFLVRKDLLVRLHTPRFFTQGDETVISAVVHNYLDHPKEVRVQVAAEGIALSGVFETTLASQSERRFDWPVTIGRAGTARITVKALTDEESDAMELKVPVLPHGSLQWESRAGLVEDVVTETLTVPGDAIHEATELLVGVSPTHAATVLEALDYLAGYPYGCVEQTMSRFLPSTITRRVLLKLKIQKPWLEEQLPDMIEAGLRRLADFQHGDGGWGWWKNDETNPFMTAYVVYGLALAREADVAVNDTMFGRGVASVQAQLAKAKEPEEIVYLLHALSAAGQTNPARRNAVADGLGELPPASKAMLALVLARDGATAEAKRVLAALAAEAVDVGATAHWKASESYRWMGHATEATALALRAFLAIEPEHPLVAKTVTWLALHREGSHWVSTRQTALVVLALAEYLERTGDLEPEMTITLEINGEQVYERVVNQANWHEFDATVSLDESRLLIGENTVTIRKTGKGTPVYSIYLKHFRKADTFAPSAGGLRVDREYFRVRMDGKERKLEPLPDGATVKSGDEIEVRLTVRSDLPHRYLMLEDPMPSGFEAEREERFVMPHRGWTWWYANKAFRDEKVEIAVTYLPEGERVVSYVMRAETPGTFKVLPAIVWNMYRPGEGGNSAGRTIRVLD